MGIFGELFGAIGEGITEGLRGPNSDERTWHTFTSDVIGELKTDKQYMEVFKAALASIHEKRPEDTFMAFCFAGGVECAKQIDGCIDGEEIGHNVGWRIYCGRPWETKMSFPLRLLTPNALQKDANGNVLKKGDEHKALSESLLARRKLPKLSSFLGVSFGSNFKNYVNDESEEFSDEEGCLYIDAKMNHFMEFTQYRVIVPYNSHEVIGVWCAAKVSNVDDCVAKIASVLEEKYKRKFEKLDDGVFSGCGIVFYDDEAKKENQRHRVELGFGKDGTVKLMAFDLVAMKHAEDAYESEMARKRAREEEEAARKKAEMERRKAQKEAEEARKKAERERRKAQKEAKERAAALDAL